MHEKLNESYTIQVCFGSLHLSYFFMGLIRAIIITAIVFFVARLLNERFVDHFPSSIRSTVKPNTAIIIIFIVEMLL